MIDTPYKLKRDPKERDSLIRWSCKQALEEMQQEFTVAGLNTDHFSMPLPITDTRVRYNPSTDIKLEIEVTRVFQFPGIHIKELVDALWHLIHYQLKELFFHDPTADCKVCQKYVLLSYCCIIHD